MIESILLLESVFFIFYSDSLSLVEEITKLIKRKQKKITTGKEKRGEGGGEKRNKFRKKKKKK